MYLENIKELTKSALTRPAVNMKPTKNLRMTSDMRLTYQYCHVILDTYQYHDVSINGIH